MKKFIEMHNDVVNTSIFSPVKITSNKEDVNVDCKYFKFSLPKVLKKDVDAILECVLSKLNKRLNKEHCIASVHDVFEVNVNNEVKYFLPLYYADNNRVYLYEIVDEHYTHYRKWISYNDIVSDKPKDLLKQLLQVNNIHYEEF